VFRVCVCVLVRKRKENPKRTKKVTRHKEKIKRLFTRRTYIPFTIFIFHPPPQKNNKGEASPQIWCHVCVCVYARSERDAHVSMVSSIARPLRCLEKEAHDFSSRMLALRFLMRHHPVRRRDHEVPELSRRENIFT